MLHPHLGRRWFWLRLGWRRYCGDRRPHLVHRFEEAVEEVGMLVTEAHQPVEGLARDDRRVYESAGEGAPSWGPVGSSDPTAP